MSLDIIAGKRYIWTLTYTFNYTKYFKKSHPKFQFNKHARVVTKTGDDQSSKMRAGRVRGMADLFDEMD